jgi:magnesium transporter
MLINCVAYEDGRKLAECSVEDISEYLARPSCFVWVALKDATPEELSTMQHEFGLHDLAVEDARHGHQRPKIEEYGETLFAVLHTVEMTSAEEMAVGELDIFVGPISCSRLAAACSRASSACGLAPSASRTCCGTARPSSSMP